LAKNSACAGPIHVEHRLYDGSRADILTQDFAIEVDWSGKSLKWAEAVGQACFYREVTGREHAVVLLISKNLSNDEKNISRALIATRTLSAGGRPVEVWVYDCQKKRFQTGRFRYDRVGVVPVLEALPALVE